MWYVIYQGKVEFISKYIEIMCCLKYRQVGKKSGASMKKKKNKNTG